MTAPGKYSRIERERLFLLRHMPAGMLTMNLPKKGILDNYIVDTNLRLRAMSDENSKIFKLAKKTTLSPGKDEITTIYLSPEEHGILNKLHAIVVSKTRSLMPHDNLIIAIDSYINETDELWLAEVEFETDAQMYAFEIPMPYEKEVTGDANFSGFALANRFGSENRRF